MLKLTLIIQLEKTKTINENKIQSYCDLFLVHKLTYDRSKMVPQIF